MGRTADDRLNEQTEFKAAHQDENIFPLYMMKIDGKFALMNLQVAGIKYDSGFEQVDIVGYVVEKNTDGYSVREITTEERRAICNIADEYSNNK